jgi:hypothetical protein
MLLVSGGTRVWAPLIAERPDIFGALAVPNDWNALPPGGRWAADNGAFSGFDEGAYIAMLERHAYARDRCLFATAPDVVGGAAETLALFDTWEPRLRERGYPVALVAQDGLTHNDVPWNRVDAIFIGGRMDTKWKTCAMAAFIVRRANELGKWVHMGRVNAARRIHFAAVIGCDSIDGSGFSKYSKEMLKRHGRLLRDLSEQRRLVLDALRADRTP